MQEFAEMLNKLPGWDRAMGVTVTSATIDEVTATWEVGPQHLQAYGIVHGGVYCGVIESIASVGAALVALPRGQRVVGLENSTTFIKAVRGGTLRAVGKPVTRGRSTQVWEVWVRDETDHVVAQGRVRLLCLAGDGTIGA